MNLEPHECVPKGPLRDLLYAYDIVVREMGTWDYAPIRLWVERLKEDRERFMASYADKAKASAP